VPEISRFFGIVIAIFYNDHAPPHFHVRYGAQKAIVAIDTLEVLEGTVSRRALGLVVEWAAQHRHELREDWALARQGLPLRRIAPLE
jgi:hypothetical protein